MKYLLTLEIDFGLYLLTQLRLFSILQTYNLKVKIA